jgi:hypothetical protein
MKQQHASEEQLNDLIDGLLEPSEREVVTTHLENCAHCADAAARLRTLMTMTAALPRSVEPPAGTWEAIAARTTQAGLARRTALRQLRGPLMAAAVLIVALTAGLTSVLLRGRETTAPPIAELTPTGAGTLVVAEEAYQREFERVLGEFRARSDQLDPASVAIVEENLRIIEQALSSARAALEADPANRELPVLITDTHRKRIDIVERALRLSGPPARREA